MFEQVSKVKVSRAQAHEIYAYAKIAKEDSTSKRLKTMDEVMKLAEEASSRDDNNVLAYFSLRVIEIAEGRQSVERKAWLKQFSIIDPYELL